MEASNDYFILDDIRVRHMLTEQKPERRKAETRKKKERIESTNFFTEIDEQCAVTTALWHSRNDSAWLFSIL